MSEPSLPPLAIGLGEILWDLLPSGKQLGGAPANFAFHAQALGATSAVVSAVGRDELGTEILDRLRGLGLDTRYVAVDPRHPTGTVSVSLDAAGVPSYVIHADVAWDFIPDSQGLRELAGRAQVICFGSLAQRSPVSRGTVHAFLGASRPEALRIFDINLRQHYYTAEAVRASLALATVLKINDEELPRVAELLGLPRDEGGTMRALFERFPLRVVALTRGGRGSSLYAPGDVSHHAGFPVAIVDTVGAGDAFTAALAMGLLRGRPLARINELANRLAAFVCSQPGATPVVPEGLVREWGGI